MCFICKNLQKSFKTIRSSYQDQYGIEKLIYLTTHTLYQTINCISNKQINMRIYMYIIYIYIYIYHIYIIYTRDGSRTYFRCCYTYLSFYLCFILSFKKKKLLHVLIFIKLLLEKIQEQSKIIWMIVTYFSRHCTLQNTDICLEESYYNMWF